MGHQPQWDGMAGAQALVAMKNGTVVVVKKYSLASYSDIKETSKLTVDVWDLSAESDSAGNFVIFASVKVPVGPSVNQIGSSSRTNSTGAGSKIKELNAGFHFGLLALLGSLTVF
ncbi:hypothetical protein GH714_025369 [Hevea brasiliensis]|uniref:AIR12 DOMON domain-containing protein n=1 Tax=Hevea brasiliensis TaxID=3981 RepID=A0A6A6KU47_HEVBR|nr:hypothetical protein GH714_025369 [Hevea brasiliensis]